jgi:hypothetical protein
MAGERGRGNRTGRRRERRGAAKRRIGGLVKESGYNTAIFVIYFAVITSPLNGKRIIIFVLSF